MRTYCKIVAPRNMKMIKLYKEKKAIFDKYRLEDQIRVIYEEQVNLKSGGYVIIEPTEAMITIDVNSGRASNKKNVEETAFKTNIEAAEEIAKQLRLRDLGGLIVIDFIDMRDRKHEAEVEKTFKKAMSVDRARIQLSRISKFGLLELSRQKKQSTIQEISYTPCPFCKGSGVRPSLEYTSLSAFRMMESRAVTGKFAELKIVLPYEISDYLLNMKRSEINKLEATYDVSIRISGTPDMAWEDIKIQTFGKEIVPDVVSEPETETEIETEVETESDDVKAEDVDVKPDDQNIEVFYQTLSLEGNEDKTAIDVLPAQHTVETPRKKQRRRPRRRKKKSGDRPEEMEIELLSESIDETVLVEGYLKVYEDL
jgi:ribonuclease E